MPLTQHAPAAVALPRDDKPANISSRSPPLYSPVRSVVSNLPSRDSPPPPSKSGSRPTSPVLSRDAAKSTSQPEEKSEKAVAEDDAEDEPEEDDKPIDMETFTQILELDDEEEDDREFSRGMVYEYFAQVEKTFKELDEALENKNLASLSSLGHYLKGSSAALGVTHVQESCEKIQHYGAMRDEDKDVDLSEEQALSLIRSTLARCKKQYAAADKWLRKFYNESAEDS